MRIQHIALSILLAAAILPSISAPATAQQGDRRGHGHGHGNNAPRGGDLNAVYDQLQVSDLGRGGVVLDYTINARAWNQLRQANIVPQLNIYAPDHRNTRYEFVYSVKLDRAQGRITYPANLGLSGATTVEIQTIGFEGASYISRSTLGRASEAALRLPVGGLVAQPQPQPQPQPNHPHNPDRPDRPDRPHQPPFNEPSDNERRAQVIQACNSIGSFDSERRACQERAMSLRGPLIAETIKACGKIGRSAASFDACFAYANANPFPYRVDSIEACNAISTFESDFKVCAGKLAALPQPAAPIVRECKASTSFTSELNTCLDLAAPLGQGAEAVVRACKQGSNFNSDFQRCMRDANRPVSGPRR
jgi:hypothetical protein